MRRPLRLGLLTLTLALAAGPRGEARESGVGPGPPIWPLPGQKDWQLYEKAVRLQRGMWRHISPQGLLVYWHRLDADADELSHDAADLSDAAIWTGCYAASQACRWHVTRDPDALEQCRVLARGLALLCDVTGVPGRIVRTVGRLKPGDPVPKHAGPSPAVPSLVMWDDASRDQLSGVVLGWACLAKYVDDPEVRALAREQAGAIARRLHADGMWIRNSRGEKTEHGELRPDVKHLPLLRKIVKVKNGPLASIGLAAIVVGHALDPSPDLKEVLDRMDREGWDGALREQHTWTAALVNASNVNMVNLALLAIRLHGDENMRKDAHRGIVANRRATVGWWNAGFTACQLLAGEPKGYDETLGETRAVLHLMPEDEVLPGHTVSTNLDRITTIAERGVFWWAWSDGVRLLRRYDPWLPGQRRWTATRADWLFAYWLARAAGELRPLVGPGAEPTAHRIEPDLPDWRRRPAPAEAPDVPPGG